MAIVNFEGGPAGQRAVLRLRRLPVFLRVVLDVEHRRWDALDRVDDEPRPEETVYIYARAAFMHGRGAGRMATYRYLPMAPAVRSMARSNELWRELVDTFPAMTEYKPDRALHG